MEPSSSRCFLKGERAHRVMAGRRRSVRNWPLRQKRRSEQEGNRSLVALPLHGSPLEAHESARALYCEPAGRRVLGEGGILRGFCSFRPSSYYRLFLQSLEMEALKKTDRVKVHQVRRFSQIYSVALRNTSWGQNRLLLEVIASV